MIRLSLDTISDLTLLVEHWERHLQCKKSHSRNPRKSMGTQPDL